MRVIHGAIALIAIVVGGHGIQASMVNRPDIDPVVNGAVAAPNALPGPVLSNLAETAVTPRPGDKGLRLAQKIFVSIRRRQQQAIRPSCRWYGSGCW